MTIAAIDFQMLADAGTCIGLREILKRYRGPLQLATERLVQRLDWLDAEIIALRDCNAPSRVPPLDQRTGSGEEQHHVA